MLKKIRPVLAAVPALLLAACAGGGGEVPSWGADLAAVTTSNKLITFNHGTPGTLARRPLELDGADGVHAVAVDFGPGVFGIDWD